MSRHLTQVASSIGGAFLAGPWEPSSMADRAGIAIQDRRRVWLRELAVVVVHAFATAPVDAPRELADVIAHCDVLGAQWHADRREGRAPWRPRVVLVPSQMGATRWPVLRLDSVGDLANELGLHPARLRWLADVASLERTVPDEALRHYRYRWIPKRTGGARLIEAPKPRLKLVQRHLLREVVSVIPPHEAAHGFRPGRSVHTYASPHVGCAVVVRLDLEGFFASVAAGRVFGILRTAGYPEAVAHVLTGLVTNTTPLATQQAVPTPASHGRAAHRRHLQHLAHPHLPQGAPTSPALANLAAYALDRRLTGLAASFGATYTRYADDLAFSGPHRLRRSCAALVDLVNQIVRDEGFVVQRSKTRIATSAERQLLAGLVVNQRPNVPRADFDQLKAVVHDAATNGPVVANREDRPDFRSHLLGRISWVEASNPTRGAKLRASCEDIAW